MKLHLYLLATILMAALSALAQTEPAKKTFFPDEHELGGALHVSSDAEIEDSAKLSKIADGKLIADVGFIRYARRDFSAGNASALAVEVITLLDARASYSLLTLLRKSPIQTGPPGIAFAADKEGMCFSHGRFFVRLHATGIPEELARKAALSINNRMGSEPKGPPSLITHLPKEGFDASSLHYFPAISAYTTFADGNIPPYLDPKYDMEVAQARYFAGARSGMISLLKFPTPELAEEYFAELSIPAAAQKEGSAIYAKHVGPLVACLEGNFDPASADKLLKSVKFGYSVRWVEEKGNNTKIIWGIPIGILGAVVNSLIFVAILCVASIFIGAIFAVVRFLLKGFASRHSSGPEEESDITRLRLQ